MDSEEKTTIEEVIEHVDPLNTISFQEQEKNLKEITKITNDNDNKEVIKWLEKNGEDFDIPHNALALKKFFHKHRERMHQSGYTPNSKELTQDDIVSDVMNDVYDDNEEPEEKKVVDKIKDNSFDKLLQFIDTLSLKKEDNLFLAKSVFTEMGFSWNGSTTMKSMPKKFASFKRNVWYLKKEAVIKMLFSSKKKNISSFINNLLEEACND